MSFDTYAGALAWIYSFSDTERTGQFVRDREDNLARERALLAALENPHMSYRVIHVAGTKGKGSTSAMIAAILRAAGQRTGLYTQPDLHTFRERMRVDGAIIPEAEVVRLAPQVRDALATVDPALGPFITYEIATALAFLYFREAGVQVAVIEVGLGGRLDATNVVEPAISVITSISYDHMQVLGNTLAEIAGEKAGIIKRGVPVVTSAMAPEAISTIERIAAEREAPLIRVGPSGTPSAAFTYQPAHWDSSRQWFSITGPHGTLNDVELALLGEHQIENAAAALAVAERLDHDGILAVSEDAVRAGLRDARWPARLQVVRREPWVVVDGAHNADSFAKLFAALRRHFPFERLILVLGLMADKDQAGIAAEIAQAGVETVVATSIAMPRAAPPEGLAALLAVKAPTVRAETRPTTAEALAEALRRAGPYDLVCVAGSLYIAGEALRWLAAQPETLPGAIEIAGVDH
ncbi:MAG TPA: folylpolyglutamate synthase/dihydrofolate synthase family protein [Ktedonobacterales bacterium]|nr:folylpolyglutamate synthase/dihydrofolate synthase family protein [Ktedonobacterales bacterium]